MQVTLILIIDDATKSNAGKSARAAVDIKMAEKNVNTTHGRITKGAGMTNCCSPLNSLGTGLLQDLELATATPLALLTYLVTI